MTESQPNSDGSGETNNAVATDDDVAAETLAAAVAAVVAVAALVVSCLKECALLVSVLRVDVWPIELRRWF